MKHKNTYKNSKIAMCTIHVYSFGMTENYFIYVESPLCFNIPSVLTCNMRQVPPLETMYWNPKGKTTLYLIEKK